MKNITSTLYIFLKQEWISVAVYFLATILFLFIIYTSGLGNDDPIGHQRITIMMISLLSLFIGIYLGSGFLRLKRSHLWQTLPHYRNNLVISFVSAAAIYGTLQTTAMLYSGWSFIIAWLAPICITLLAAQLVIGNNLIMKVILPASPFIIFQLNQYNVDYQLLLVILILFASLAVYLNYENKTVLSDATIGLMSGNMMQQLKNVRVQKFNILIATIFQALGVKYRKKDLSVAFLQPNNRYGVSSSIGVTFILLFFHLINDNQMELEGISGLMLLSILMGVLMELKLLAPQSKSLAHVYSQEQHQDFKARVLAMIERHVLVQSIVYGTLILLLNSMIEDFVEPLPLIRYVATAALSAIIFMPAFLCLSWVNINFKLLAVIICYFVTTIISFGWFYNRDTMDILFLQIIGTGILLVSIRYLSKVWWRRFSMEQFMRSYP
ncbi:MAG: hypothetical protein KUG78_21040 [Kangiellaceae bacterium]|nr:hypothetical protein [Kangiellaceae bacterium]